MNRLNSSHCVLSIGGTSQGGQLERIHLPVQEMQETRVLFLRQEAPLEKGMAIQSTILAWRIPWTEEPGVLQSKGSQESDMT